MDYESMSDFEINCCVAIAKGCDMVREAHPSSSSVYCGYEGLESTQNERDYCSNPADIMPIAIKIWGSLMSSEAGDYITLWERIISKYKCNQYRAAAIAYLMAKDDKGD